MSQPAPVSGSYYAVIGAMIAAAKSRNSLADWAAVLEKIDPQMHGTTDIADIQSKALACLLRELAHD